ncbi:hypothetical protein [Salinithrix halophila]|uniref:Uncharacterized protein n=1 Tax=Salinithrix halophila TaxID=1485204 RepID=A0ABV8JIW8_9BACL
MRMGKVAFLLGAVISLAGMSLLFREERIIARRRLCQALGWGVFSFGLAHILLGGLNAALRR